ncbi:TAFII28-domain-containing protein [Schizophyllum commune H4-8]|nr:TAFII28-domain-containing protein [Schizophyllum commune H4-8]KAI5891593.1 TAFII28-domain-containing protein [Schizophyllum commune H4-8]
MSESYFQQNAAPTTPNHPVPPNPRGRPRGSRARKPRGATLGTPGRGTPRTSPSFSSSTFQVHWANDDPPRAGTPSALQGSLSRNDLASSSTQPSYFGAQPSSSFASSSSQPTYLGAQGTSGSSSNLNAGASSIPGLDTTGLISMDNDDDEDEEMPAAASAPNLNVLPSGSMAGAGMAASASMPTMSSGGITAGAGGSMTGIIPGVNGMPPPPVPGGEDGDVDDELLPAMTDADFTAQQTFMSQSKDNLKVLMDEFSPEQYDRFEAYRRHALPKQAVRKVIQQTVGQQVSQPVAQIVAGFAKVFVGEIVEKARAVQRRRGDTGPLTPDHMREAYRMYQQETGRVGAARPLKGKKVFVR